MADIGSYLDDMPINCVLFVLQAKNPRIDHTLKRLMEIVIHKVHRSDYNKLGVIVNHYSHSAASKAERAELNGKTEQQTQQAIRDEIAKSLHGNESVHCAHVQLVLLCALNPLAGISTCSACVVSNSMCQASTVVHIGCAASKHPWPCTICTMN